MVKWKEPDYGLETGKRYHVQDMIPRYMPDSLDDLKGDPHAVISLPVTVYWGPGYDRFDLSKEADAVIAYGRIVTECNADTQCRLLDRDRLIELWPRLTLERRNVRGPWESRFPILAGRTGDDR